MCIAKAISRVWPVSLVAVLLTILSSNPALPQFPPPQNTNVERPAIGSGRVSLGHGDFVLKFREGMGFVLENETQGRRWPVKLLVGSENKEESLLDKAKKDHAKVDQVELARHSRDSMICVVKTRTEDDAELTVFSISSGQLTAKELNLPARYSFKSDRRDSILAVCGTVNSPLVTIVTGKFSDIEPGAVTTGTVTIEVCGMIEGARTGKFKTQYQPIPPL